MGAGYRRVQDVAYNLPLNHLLGLLCNEGIWKVLVGSGKIGAKRYARYLNWHLSMTFWQFDDFYTNSSTEYLINKAANILHSLPHWTIHRYQRILRLYLAPVLQCTHEINPCLRCSWSEYRLWYLSVFRDWWMSNPPQAEERTCLWRWKAPEAWRENWCVDKHPFLPLISHCKSNNAFFIWKTLGRPRMVPKAHSFQCMQ